MVSRSAASAAMPRQWGPRGTATRRSRSHGSGGPAAGLCRGGKGPCGRGRPGRAAPASVAGPTRRRPPRPAPDARSGRSGTQRRRRALAGCWPRFFRSGRRRRGDPVRVVEAPPGCAGPTRLCRQSAGGRRAGGPRIPVSRRPARRTVPRRRRGRFRGGGAGAWSRTAPRRG